VIDDNQAGSVILELHRATHATLHALAARLSGRGLTASEINVLANLADGRARSIGDLGSVTATRPTTLTSVLDRLAGRDFVTREVDPADRRSFLVSLTPAGRRAARAAAAAAADLERAALTAVGDRDLAGFRAVTRALTEATR
jgi:MarR family transcriptional regulator, organic hydroperoxide resistance regulator